jgi:hypothetical protein
MPLGRVRGYFLAVADAEGLVEAAGLVEALSDGFTVAEGLVEAAGLVEALSDGSTVADGLTEALSDGSTVADVSADGLVAGSISVAGLTAADVSGAWDAVALLSVQAAKATARTNASTMKPIFFICDVSPFAHLKKSKD